MEPEDDTVKLTSSPNKLTDDEESVTGPQTTPLGARIRKERQRLGLSQAALAKLAGVHRKTQMSYELGSRKPDTDYLQGFASAGGDVGYLLTGDSQREAETVLGNTLDSISVVLGLHHGFKQEWDSVFELVRDNWRAPLQDTALRRSNDDAIRALFAKSPWVLGGPQELAELVERIEFVAASTGISISPHQKGRAVFLLLQEKRRAGSESVDFETVKRTLEDLT